MRDIKVLIGVQCIFKLKGLTFKGGLEWEGKMHLSLLFLGFLLRAKAKEERGSILFKIDIIYLI